jgi:hypothetical protein
MAALSSQPSANSSADEDDAGFEVLSSSSVEEQDESKSLGWADIVAAIQAFYPDSVAKDDASFLSRRTWKACLSTAGHYCPCLPVGLCPHCPVTSVGIGLRQLSVAYGRIGCWRGLRVVFKSVEGVAAEAGSAPMIPRGYGVRTGLVLAFAS